MATYSFRTNHIPGVVVTDDRSAHVLYGLGGTRMAVAQWAGVMERSVASSLKPWAEAVPLQFSAFCCDRNGWHELDKEEFLWGVLLRGKQPQDTALFSLLLDGRPLIGQMKPGQWR